MACGGARRGLPELMSALSAVIVWPMQQQVLGRTAITVGLVGALCVIVSAVDAVLVAALVAARKVGSRSVSASAGAA